MPACCKLVSGKPRVFINGRLFALHYPTMSEAQQFVDLLNDHLRRPTLIQPTIFANNRTYTLAEWHLHLDGKL